MASAKEREALIGGMQPRSFLGELRIASIERMRSSISSSTSLGQPCAGSRLAKDQTPSSEFGSGA